MEIASRICLREVLPAAISAGVRSCGGRCAAIKFHVEPACPASFTKQEREPASGMTPPEGLLCRYAHAIIKRKFHFFLEVLSLEAFLWLVFN